MKFTNEQLISYSRPISETEEERCKNAIRMVSDALKNMGYLEKKDIELAYRDTFAYTTTLQRNNIEIKLLVQGSYANNTNVKVASDVDIAVIQTDVFNSEYRSGVSKSDYNFVSSEFTFKEYKTMIYDVLAEKFSKESVHWRNKCITVHGNTYRVDADTVPARRYRDYTQDFWNDPENFVGGIKFFSDSGEEIINYPEQHIKNGRDKNIATDLYYKKLVRIIKKMRYLMIDEQIKSAETISSFTLESLLWNLPDSIYRFDVNYVDKFRFILEKLKEEGMHELSNYTEVNGIKPLCDNNHEEEKLQKFIIDLYNFFEY